MLVQLTPEQISKYWEQLDFAIQESLPAMVGEDVKEKMSNILLALLDNRMQAWASCTVESEGIEISGFIFTHILEDLASGIKSLLIYCLYGYDDVSEVEWIDGLRTLKKFEAATGCRRTVAYTKIPHMIEVAKKLGGNTDYTFVVF